MAARFFYIVRQRLRSLFQRDTLDNQLDEELRFHLEQLEKENLESGMNAAEARRAARRTLGNVAVLKEECRDERRVSWFYDLCQDIRYGARMMRKHPGFTAIAAISLALGIGANTAILNVGASITFKALPVPDSGRLVIVRTNPAENPFQNSQSSVPDYVAWSERNHTFETMGASLASQQDLGGDEVGATAERIAGQSSTPSVFATLKVAP